MIGRPFLLRGLTPLSARGVVSFLRSRTLRVEPVVVKTRDTRAKIVTSLDAVAWIRFGWDLTRRD